MPAKQSACSSMRGPRAGWPRLRRRAGASRCTRFGDAEQVLHVMADLVRDDVGVGEVAAGLELGGQLVEEAQVEEDALVGRAVERSHRRTPRRRSRIPRRRGTGPASAPGTAPPMSANCRVPGVLGLGEHRGDECSRHSASSGDSTYGSVVVCTGALPAPCSIGVGSPPRNITSSAIASVPRPPPTSPPRLTRMPRRSSMLSLCRRPSQRMVLSSS